MKAELKLLFEKVMEDKELQAKLAACKSPEEAYAVAGTVQDGFTMEEFVDAVQECLDEMNEVELSDEDLAKAAGGSTADQETTVACYTIVSAVSVGTAAAGAILGGF